jgi:hypothetical protein
MGSSLTDLDCLTAQDGHAVAAANLQPDPAETIEDDDETNFEGPGDSDNQVLLDSTGDLCDGKLETGNWKLRAQFG